MGREQINDVVTSLRPLQVDFSELTNEINDLWRQLRAVQRTRYEERGQIATIVRLHLTDSIEKMQTLLATLSTQISTIQTALPLSKSMKLSTTFESDLEFLLEHLIGIRDEKESQLLRVSDCLECDEIEDALTERNLYEENYRLSTSLRRIKADLSLVF